MDSCRPSLLKSYPNRCDRVVVDGVSSSPPRLSEDDDEAEGALVVVRVSFSRSVRNKLNVNSAKLSAFRGP